MSGAEPMAGRHTAAPRPFSEFTTTRGLARLSALWAALVPPRQRQGNVRGHLMRMAGRDAATDALLVARYFER